MRCTPLIDSKRSSNLMVCDAQNSGLAGRACGRWRTPAAGRPCESLPPGHAADRAQPRGRLAPPSSHHRHAGAAGRALALDTLCDGLDGTEWGGLVRRLGPVAAGREPSGDDPLQLPDRRRATGPVSAIGRIGECRPGCRAGLDRGEEAAPGGVSGLDAGNPQGDDGDEQAQSVAAVLLLDLASRLVCRPESVHAVEQATSAPRQARR